MSSILTVAVLMRNTSPKYSSPDKDLTLAVEAQFLLKKYGISTVVDRIDFTVWHGEAFGLLGPNGAGKSTTLRMIYCRTNLTSGKLRVDGFNVKHDAPKIKALIGVVPQENNLDPDLNVIENLMVYARYFQIDLREAVQRARELLEFMGLDEKHDAEVETLSGGMKRRLVVARALINNPKILILDEPTMGLDPHARHDLWDRLRELRSRKITILISTHYMEEAERLCDRLIIMDKGRILTLGKPKTLIETHVSKFVLEVHEVNTNKRVSLPQEVIVESHGPTLYYFSPSPELLTPLIREHEGYSTLLRPSNLEDVFLKMTGRQRAE